MALQANQKFVRSNYKLVSTKEQINTKNPGVPMVTGLLRNQDGNVQAFSAYGPVAVSLLNPKTQLGSELRVLAIDSAIAYQTNAGMPAIKHDLKIAKFWFVSIAKQQAA